MKERFENIDIKRSQEDTNFFNNIVRDYEKEEASVKQDAEYFIVSVPGLNVKTYIHKWRKIPKADDNGNIVSSVNIKTVIKETILKLEARRDDVDNIS